MTKTSCMRFKAGKSLKHVNGDNIFSTIFMQNQVHYSEIHCFAYCQEACFLIKNYAERSFTVHVLFCQPGFVCSSGFDAQQAGDFLHHQIENLFVI